MLVKFGQVLTSTAAITACKEAGAKVGRGLDCHCLFDCRENLQKGKKKKTKENKL